MRQILIELHIPNALGEFYMLEHPTVGEPKFYTQAVSYTYFRERELKRAFPDVTSGNLIKGLTWVEYAATIKYCSEHSGWPGKSYEEYLAYIHIDIEQVPICKGVWDFYEKIGYDRKSKRYI